MNRPRLIRGLRIAWTAVFGIICLLLIVLWVQSYSVVDSFRWGLVNNDVIVLDSKSSRLYLSGSTSGGADLQPFLRNQKPSDGQVDLLNRILSSENHWGFGKYIDLKLINTSTLILPHWFPVVLSAFFAVLPWIRWRFSIRTLLLVTTLIAVVLGLVGWSLGR